MKKTKKSNIFKFKAITSSGDTKHLDEIAAALEEAKANTSDKLVLAKLDYILAKFKILFYQKTKDILANSASITSRQGVKMARNSLKNSILKIV